MKQTNKAYLIFAIIVVGFCLRPSLTGIGSLLRLIKPDLGLTDTAAGMLTTIPMAVFALVSPLTAKLNRRVGTAKTLFCGFGAIIVGILARSYGGIAGLYVGTVLIGVGIAFGNVLLPAVIKAEYPQSFSVVMALNSVALALSSAAAAGVNYPLAAEVGLGWQGALCVWIPVAVLGMLAWLPVRGVNVPTQQDGVGRRLLKNPLAWSVTLFLGVVALLFYSCMSWLSSIFQFKGLDAATAGYFVSAFQLTGIFSSFLIPVMAGKSSDQRKTTYLVLTIFLLGMAAITLSASPGVLLLGALLAGFGCNGCFALSMSFIGFRAADGGTAAALSAMSQSFGYVIAALGPMGMGFLRSLSGGWDLSLWVILALILLLFAIAHVCAGDKTL